MTAERIVAPRTLDEAAELFKEAAARGETVSIRGGCTETGVGYPERPSDVLVRTTLLDRIVEYAPADLVVQVEAGATLASLQERLAPHGQRLALDPPQPERATIGGLLACNTFGPRRARFGSLRDLIVGISLIRADGERVRGGGKVVKNVAGFDIPKIAVGSLGTLGMIATATFRLHPVPASSRAACARSLSAASVRAIDRAIVAARIEPAAIVASSTGESYDLTVLFEGFESGVAEQLERFAAVAAERGASSEEVAASAPAAVDREVRCSGDVRLRAAVPPASFETLHREFVGPFVRSVDRGDVVVYPSLGVAFASGYARSDDDALVHAVRAMRRACEAVGGNLVTLAVERRELAERIDPYGTLPAAFPLMRRLKDRFDPEGRINRGRFVGKL